MASSLSVGAWFGETFGVGGGRRLLRYEMNVSLCAAQPPAPAEGDISTGEKQGTVLLGCNIWTMKSCTGKAFTAYCDSLTIDRLRCVWMNRVDAVQLIGWRRANPSRGLQKTWEQTTC